jgi:hypothetical protein
MQAGRDPKFNRRLNDESWRNQELIHLTADPWHSDNSTPNKKGFRFSVRFDYVTLGSPAYHSIKLAS